MSSVTLPDPIARAAEVQARIAGVSLEEWVSRAVAAHLDTDEGAHEFFRRRAIGATSDGLTRALEAIPDREPDPGDEFPEGWPQTSQH